MQRMVSFRLSRECREISINPSKVLYVCHYETGATSIHFGKECFVRVQGEMADVVARIEAALCDRGDEAPTAPSTPAAELKRSGVD